MEVTHVALDTHFSCGGVDSGCIWIGGIAAASAGMARILFFIFLILFVASLLSGFIRRV